MASQRATQLIALRNVSCGSRLAREALSYRRFSTVVERPRHPTKSIRCLSTSQDLKAKRDSSTIDFAYLPNADVDPEPEEVYRVPILPTTDAASINAIREEDEVVMKPQISSMSADAVFLPMADLSDGHSMDIDFHAMADRVASNLKNMKLPADEQASMMKQIWSDLVDDMLGMGKKKSGEGK